MVTRLDVIEIAEAHRRELTGYCYRYFGCAAEAEDAVQETFERAWRRADTFRGDASVRTWLYRIAVHTCIDMKRSPQRRALPTDLRPPGRVADVDDPTRLPTAPAEHWVGPIGDDRLWGEGMDPGERVAARETVRFAFLAALQLLPARQRAVLILRDVLAWSAEECAALLEVSLASVNSALARARRTLAEHRGRAPTVMASAHAAGTDVSSSKATVDADVLERYVAAFEAYDVDRLAQMLAADAEFSMPPFEFWMRGREEIEQWWRGPGAAVCLGSRALPTAINGLPAAAVYHPVGEHVWEPFAVHALDVADGRLAAITHFIGPVVFAELGLPSLLA